VNDRFGNSNAALDFPNFNSKIRIAHDLLGPTPCLADHSFSYWVKLYNQPNGNDEYTAFCLGREPGLQGVNFFGRWIASYDGKISSYYFDRVQALSIDTIATNEWHMITIVYQLNSNTFKTYIDGIENSDPNFPNVATGWTGNCTAPNPTFGNYYVGNTAYDNSKFDGNVDDLGVWNRALTQQEISNLYNGGICYQTITVTDTLLINTGITGFNPVTFENTIRIWPNPTYDHITIDAGNLNTMSGYSIRIVNALGQQVFQSAINLQQFYLDLSSWTGNGIYYVNIINPQGVTIDTRKIVLQ
jgi:hypothetical protein